MKSVFSAFAFVSFLICSYGQISRTYNSNDQAKLNELPTKWQHYWNIHDMDSMGTLLQQNVDFVNVAGVWLKGKTATVADHKQKHSGIVFKNSIWITDSVAIKYIKPDVAVIHLSWGLSGDNDPDGTLRKPRHGIFTWLVVKNQNEWKIITAQNTNKKE